MKKIIRGLAVILFVSAFLGTGISSAAFDAGKYLVDDGLLYAVDAQGNKKQVDGAEVVEEQTDGGTFYWLAADPDSGDDGDKSRYKGWKSGIYFFGSDGRFISRLERKDAATSYVKFNPDGTRFILDSGTYVDREYNLYEFAGLKFKKTFYGTSELVWLDPARFAFTLIETDQGARSGNADISGWLSVVVYDPASDELQMISRATKTEDFCLESVDFDADELIITKYSVKNEKDWADDEKKSSEKVRVPIPAAG